jgi:hypothetical protein
LVKIKDGILPKTKVQREFATNKAVKKQSVLQTSQITKLTNQK